MGLTPTPRLARAHHGGARHQLSTRSNSWPRVMIRFPCSRGPRSSTRGRTLDGKVIIITPLIITAQSSSWHSVSSSPASAAAHPWEGGFYNIMSTTQRRVRRDGRAAPPAHRTCLNSACSCSHSFGSADGPPSRGRRSNYHTALCISYMILHIKHTGQCENDVSVHS
jgi:hypothetical protein